MAKNNRFKTDQANAIRWARHHAEPGRWFWKRVLMGEPEACWPWLGRQVLRRGGYGRLMFKGKLVGAHRMALVLTSGEDRTGEFACHRCDNPICCNPAHLFWGTHQENMSDRSAKGRARGAPVKIDIERLVARRAEGLSYTALAQEFGVHFTSIGKALKRAALRSRSGGEG